MTDSMLASRFEGCLVGGAIGDALGYPVEFMSYASICSTFGPDGIQAYWLEETGGIALFSDDTQMTLFTAAGLLNAGVDASWAQYAKQIHRAYLDWLHTQESWFTKNPQCTWLLDEPQLYSHRAPGNTCLSALRSCKMGLMEKPLNNSCGCGGVMRVAPVGLFVSDSDEAAHVAALAAALTHGHPMGYIPAAALAYIVNRCVYGEPDTLAGVVDDCIRRLPAWFEDEQYQAAEMGRQLAYAAELAANSDADAVNIPLMGEGWVGDQALAIAVYACLRHPDDFSAAVIAAVNHSGDADSTGAIAGNIMGAYLGAEAIESRWTDDLELYDLLRRMASELMAATQQ